MQFDIDDTIKGMLAGAKGVLKTEWKNVKATAEQFFQNKKKRLVMLAQYRIAGKINDEELQSFIDDEKTLFSSELLALKLITKAVAQKAANAALDVLYAAIGKALGTEIEPIG